MCLEYDLDNITKLFYSGIKMTQRQLMQLFIYGSDLRKRETAKVLPHETLWTQNWMWLYLSINFIWRKKNDDNDSIHCILLMHVDVLSIRHLYRGSPHPNAAIKFNFSSNELMYLLAFTDLTHHNRHTFDVHHKSTCVIIIFL